MSQAWGTLIALLSYWRRHALQAATLLIGLSAATALWSGVQALNQQARTSYDRAAAIMGARTPMLISTDGQPIPQALFVALRRAGWPVSPVAEGRIEVNGKSIRLLGIDPVTMPVPETAKAAEAGDLGAFLQGEGQSWIALETLRDLGLATGARPLLKTGPALPPLAARDTTPPGAIVVDVGSAQSLLDMPQRLSRLTLGPQETPRRPLSEIAGERLRLVAADAETDLERLTDSFHLNLTAFGFLSFAVGLFIVNSAVGLAFEQRRPLFRTLRACGVSARMLAAVMIAELLLLALIAGVVGLVGGYVIASLLLPDVAASLRGLYGAQIPGELTLAPRWWALGLAISVAGALAASATSLVRAARLPLLAVAQPDAWQASQARWLRGQMLAAVVILVLGGFCFAFGDSLLAGFATLGALLVGAALMLPVVLAAILRLLEARVRGVISRWALADARQQMGGLSLALMALLLALAVNVGVSTMVGSFSTTFRVWLDGRLSADVFLTARDDAQARDIVAWLKTRGDVTAILPGGRAETQLGGLPTDLIAFADHPIYRREWPLLEQRGDAWDRLHSGGAAFASEQLARRMNLSLGARIEVPTPTGIWPLTIVAIYADYGNPKGQLGVDIAALQARFPQTLRTRFGVLTQAGRAADVVADLRARFGLDERSLADQATVKAESLRIFARTFSVTAALNSFTLGVAGIALLTSLLTLGGARLPQLAPLWAMGLTRARLGALEFAKTLLLALLTALLALPLGLAVAWCLLAIVNVKAFGWRLPLHVFPLDMAALLVVALLAAAAAALWPIVRLARMAPTDLLRVFSHER